MMYGSWWWWRKNRASGLLLTWWPYLLRLKTSKCLAVTSMSYVQNRWVRKSIIYVLKTEILPRATSSTNRHWSILSRGVAECVCWGLITSSPHRLPRSVACGQFVAECWLSITYPQLHTTEAVGPTFLDRFQQHRLDLALPLYFRWLIESHSLRSWFSVSGTTLERARYNLLLNNYSWLQHRGR